MAKAVHKIWKVRPAVRMKLGKSDIQSAQHVHAESVKRYENTKVLYNAGIHKEEIHWRRLPAMEY